MLPRGEWGRRKGEKAKRTVTFSAHFFRTVVRFTARRWRRHAKAKRLADQVQDLDDRTVLLDDLNTIL